MNKNDFAKFTPCNKSKAVWFNALVDFFLNTSNIMSLDHDLIAIGNEIQHIIDGKKPFLKYYNNENEVLNSEFTIKYEPIMKSKRAMYCRLVNYLDTMLFYASSNDYSFDCDDRMEILYEYGEMFLATYDKIPNFSQYFPTQVDIMQGSFPACPTSVPQNNGERFLKDKINHETSYLSFGEKIDYYYNEKNKFSQQILYSILAEILGHFPTHSIVEPKNTHKFLEKVNDNVLTYISLEGDKIYISTINRETFDKHMEEEISIKTPLIRLLEVFNQVYSYYVEYFK